MLTRWRLRFFRTNTESTIEQESLKDADALSRSGAGGSDFTKINNDPLVAISSLYENQKDATKASPYTACDMCGRKEQKPGKMMPDV